MASSDFSSTYMLGVRLVSPSRAGPAHESGHGRDLPGSAQRTSPRAQGLRLREALPMQAISPWDDVAFSSTEGDRHLGIRPVSQLNTWPVVSPVNASRRPSRDAAHHSGSGGMAGPSPWRTFTSYSLPAFLAHSLLGPGCVKSRTSQGRAELFSQLSTLDRRCECNCFRYRRN
jgi:hypothetical protein